VISTEELFATPSDWGRLHDVFAELDFEAGRPERSYSKEEAFAAWERLPEDIRNIAHCWSIGDTVFGDEAYVFFRDNPHLLP
jgi:hypothetical protein